MPSWSVLWPLWQNIFTQTQRHLSTSSGDFLFVLFVRKKIIRKCVHKVTMLHRLIVFNYLSIHKSYGKKIGHKMYALFFSAAFVRFWSLAWIDILWVMVETRRGTHAGNHIKCSVLLSDLSKLVICWKILIELPIIKFHESPGVLDLLDTARRTWRSQLTNLCSFY